MRVLVGCIAALAFSAAACQRATAPGANEQIGGPPHTALDLHVMRGPVTPVCRIDTPCDAPFSAQFSVLQGERAVLQFTTDSAGHALVPLAAGTYTVVPAANAPIIAPQSQHRSVVVRAEGITTDTLRFDTGIR